MGIVEKWNSLARKSLYVNKTFEIGMGRLMYMVILNCFLMTGMILTGGTPASIVWLWGDMVSSFRKQNNRD